MADQYSHYGKKTIKEIHYNYGESASDGREVWPDHWETGKVGEKGCVAIHEHPAGGEGDRWFYDIVYDTGTVIRTFNPCKVIFEFDAQPTF